MLANTYLIYTVDNGFHLGLHRLPAGQTCSIEEDVNAPFITRDPRIAKGRAVSFPTSHTDIVPAPQKLADAPPRNNFDGSQIPVKAAEQTRAVIRSEHVNIAFWGHGIIEGTELSNWRRLSDGSCPKTRI